MSARSLSHNPAHCLSLSMLCSSKMEVPTLPQPQMFSSRSFGSSWVLNLTHPSKSALDTLCPVQGFIVLFVWHLSQSHMLAISCLISSVWLTAAVSLFSSPAREPFLLHLDDQVRKEQKVACEHTMLVLAFHWLVFSKSCAFLWMPLLCPTCNRWKHWIEYSVYTN